MGKNTLNQDKQDARNKVRPIFFILHRRKNVKKRILERGAEIDKLQF